MAASYFLYTTRIWARKFQPITAHVFELLEAKTSDVEIDSEGMLVSVLCGDNSMVQGTLNSLIFVVPTNDPLPPGR